MNPRAATVELIASVTGVVDDVGYLIEPGAYGASLRRRTPKVILGHDWQRPIGRVLRVRELRPGSPALPGRTASGAPWPRAAGALVVLAELNQNHQGSAAPRPTIVSAATLTTWLPRREMLEPI